MSEPTREPFPLPAGFEDLAEFADWALPTERQRHAKRVNTPLPQIERVYHALLPRIEEAIAHLDQFPLDALPQPERNLQLLTMVFVEVSPSVELLRSPTVPDGFPPERFVVHF